MKSAKSNQGSSEEKEQSWRAYTNILQNYYKTIVIKTVWYWQKAGQNETQRRIQKQTHISTFT